jgi:hypothetical protein
VNSDFCSGTVEQPDECCGDVRSMVTFIDVEAGFVGDDG